MKAAEFLVVLYIDELILPGYLQMYKFQSLSVQELFIKKLKDVSVYI